MSGELRIKRPRLFKADGTPDKRLDVIEIAARYDRDFAEDSPEYRVRSSKNVEGHFVIYAEYTDGAPGFRNLEFLGVAHNPEEVVNKVYECAKRFAEANAKKRGLRFRDLVAKAGKNP